MAIFPRLLTGKIEDNLSTSENVQKIDSDDSSYKAIVSVLRLKEGWDEKKRDNSSRGKGQFIQG
jgi:hypothetical protein